MESIVEFVSGAQASILAYPLTLFADLKLIIALIIGLPLAFWVIRKAISLVRAR